MDFEPENVSLLGSSGEPAKYDTMVDMPPTRTYLTGDDDAIDSHEEVNGESQDKHCHDALASKDDLDKAARKKLIIAIVLCISFMTAETIGGFFANSLAIMTDAAHLLSDFAAFLISLLSLYMARRPASARYNFGWHRFEVVGAIVSVLLIWVLTGSLLTMACLRLINKTYDDIDARIMLITSGLGLLVNIVMGMSLHGNHNHSHGGSNNINVRAALIHVIGDFIQSAGVLVAALLIYFIDGVAYLDPVCTIGFSIIVLFTTFNILKEAFEVLMEAIPKGVDFELVKATLMSVNGIVAVHDLRIWGLTTEKIALAAHLVIEPTQDQQKVLEEATSEIRQIYHFVDMTLQVEHFSKPMVDCKQCKTPSCTK